MRASAIAVWPMIERVMDAIVEDFYQAIASNLVDVQGHYGWAPEVQTPEFESSPSVAAAFTATRRPGLSTGPTANRKPACRAWLNAAFVTFAHVPSPHTCSSAVSGTRWRGDQ